MDRQRVTVSHVAHHGNLSRNTIYLIQQGTTTDPSPDTLRKIARGLATNARTGKFERSTYVEALRDLAAIAGRVALSEEASAIPPVDLEAEIALVVGSRRRADVLAKFLRRYPALSPDQRTLVDALLDALGNE